MALSYEGSLNYEDLKKYPFKEIEILTETMNEINKRKEGMINSAKRGNSTTIGNFN